MEESAQVGATSDIEKLVARTRRFYVVCGGFDMKKSAAIRARIILSGVGRDEEKKWRRDARGT
jgi:cell division protein FtsN